MNNRNDIMSIVVVTNNTKNDYSPSSQIGRMFPSAALVTLKSADVWERYLENYATEADRVYIDFDTIPISNPNEYMSELRKKRPDLKIYFMCRSADKLQQTGLGVEHWMINHH